MLRGEDWEAGRGVGVHLALVAVLDFKAGTGRWSRLHDEEGTGNVVALAEGLSEAHHGTEGVCWSQGIQYGFPTGEPRDVCANTVSCYTHLFPTELAGLCALLGGAVAKEAPKAVGKCTPVDQWVHNDKGALVVDACLSNVGLLFGSRHNHQAGTDGQAARLFGGVRGAGV